MAKDQSVMKEKKRDERSIVKGWARIAEYRFSGLNEQEKAQFEQAQFAEDQAKKTPFVLGEPIKRRF